MPADTTHLFLNPTAGRGRAGRRQERILALLNASNTEIQLHTSRAPGDLESQVRRAINEGASRVVIAGGDGSIHEGVNGILSADGDAAFGVIPTGTGNDFAKACEIPLNWEHATQLLAERIAASQQPRNIDAGKFNERFFANGAGLGFDAKVTRIAQSIRLPVGDLVYLLAIFRTMRDPIASPRLRIRSDDFEWDGPLTLAAISNGPWVGGMFHISPMADNSDGQMELTIARPVTRRRIMTLLPKLMNGSHVREPEIVHRPATRMTIQADQPIASHLDGEVQELQTDFEIAILPGALELL